MKGIQAQRGNRGVARLADFLVALAFCSSFAAPALAEPRRYDGHQIIEVNVKSQAQLDAIENLGGQILNCHIGPGLVQILVSVPQKQGVANLGLDVRVVNEDVQRSLERERAPLVVAAGDPFADFFLSYHPFDGEGGILWYMNELVARYPSLASMVNVGTTLEGRTIWGMRITSNAVVDKPAVLYFGAEHAREWITTTVPTFFATRLLENYGGDPQITDLVDNVEFFLIPVFNLDGYLYTWTNDRYWRKNRRGGYGVDINRNWAEGWGGQGSSSSTGSSTYRGTSPFSEPETQALRDFILAHPNLRAQLDIHSYSQLILWPFGYTSALPVDQETYEDVGFAMQSLIQSVHGRFYEAGPVYSTIYPASGVSVDWTYVQRDILSLSFECRDTGTYGFALPPDQIIPNNEELLPAMLHLANSDWVRSPIRIEFPNDVPSILTAGEDTTILVRIVGQHENIVPQSAAMNFRYDVAGSFQPAALAALGGDLYEAVLPATNCTSTPEFYFSVEGDAGSDVTSPRAAPNNGFYAAEVRTGASCDGLLGDWNGDGSHDAVDRSEFEACHAGPDVPLGVGCQVFDAEPDDDVDCNDWVFLIESWVGPGEAPMDFAPCAHRLAPAAAGPGPRYLAVTPSGGLDAVAILVESPDLPCLHRYADFDADPLLSAAGIVRLQDTPVYRLPSEWGTVMVSDADVIPDATYELRTVDEFGGISIVATAVTLRWADVGEPIGQIDVLDIAAVVNALKGTPGAPLIERADLDPAVPDHLLTVSDVSAVVDVVKGAGYPHTPPSQCP